ncbi:hypothetical protein E6O75_ATG07566 [Venturia nashicola]|uniref:Uncharacterized protein n=1 Tax=Venturia nashicola TaxID=86259 RepID=A0A4Z1PE08_9PEZI|nr:hypothetical protein E6O75_ATG07566 [Venturia nashicola]
MSFTAKPNLTKNQAKPLLHTLILTTPQALIVAINEYAAKPQFSTTRPPVFQAVQHTEHLLLFYQAPDSIPNVLALDNNNRPVQMTSPQETDCVRYSGNDGKLDPVLKRRHYYDVSDQKQRDVESRGEAQVQYVLKILQSRLEKLVAELEKVGVEVVEEEEEDSVDEQDSQKPSLISALTGEPALSPEQAQERHSLLKNTLSASRILLIAIVDFDLDLSRSRAKVIHLQASLDANGHNIRVLQNVVRETPQYILGHLFQIYCLHLNAQQPIEQWRPGAKIKRKEKSWFTTAHDGGMSYVENHAVEATGLDCGAGIGRRENRRR